MSLQLDVIKAKNQIEAITMAILSLVFALIAILLFIGLLALTGYTIDMGQLVDLAIFKIFRTPSDLAAVLYWASPLALTALAVAIAFQAGLFNIGGQGQMTMGAVSAAIWAAVIVPKNLPFLSAKIFILPTTILVGFIVGGIWGYIPGYLKAKKGAHEVITTIMMNLIALSTVTYLVGSRTYSPFIDQSSVDAYGQTDVISTNARVGLLFPHVSQFLNWTTVYTIVIIIVMQIVIFKTTFGYKLRAVGLNESAAKSVGINSGKITIWAMALSGGIAGLAGTFYVIGTPPYRYLGFDSSAGFDGIAVSLIAQNSPIAIGLAAIFFGFLAQSKNNLDFLSNIPPDLVFTLQAWVILFAAAPVVSKYVYAKIKELGINTKMKIIDGRQRSPPTENDQHPNNIIQEEEK